jgi:hypothetical protein
MRCSNPALSLRLVAALVAWSGLQGECLGDPAQSGSPRRDSSRSLDPRDAVPSAPGYVVADILFPPSEPAGPTPGLHSPHSEPFLVDRLSPRVEFGVGLGADFGVGGGSLTGLDSFGGIPRIDSRPSSSVGSQFAIGAEVSLFPFPAASYPCFSGLSDGSFHIQPYFRTGFAGLPSDGVTQNFFGVNQVPQGAGSLTHRLDWRVPIGGGFRLLSDAFAGSDRFIGLELGGGVQITQRTVGIRVFEGGAGYRAGAFGSWSRTTVDPFFSVGSPIGFPIDGFPVLLTPRVDVVFPQTSRFGVQSVNFGSQSYHVRTSSDPEVRFYVAVTAPIP